MVKATGRGQTGCGSEKEDPGWAIDPDGRMYLTKEIYRTQRIVADHAEQIVAESPRKHYRTIADHDADGRATLEREGIITEAADKAVLEGIDALTARLRIQDDAHPGSSFSETR